LLDIIRNSEGEYSLSQLQLVIWTFTILPLITAIFWKRLVSGLNDPLDVVIPTELLVVMGISGATVVGSKLVPTKDTKTRNNPEKTGSKGFFFDLIMKKRKDVPATLDMTRFQQLMITGIVVFFFVFTTVKILKGMKTSEVTEIPSFNETLVVLIGISHAGYLTMKIPDKMNEGEAKKDEDDKGNGGNGNESTPPPGSPTPPTPVPEEPPGPKEPPPSEVAPPPEEPTESEDPPAPQKVPPPEETPKPDEEDPIEKPKKKKKKPPKKNKPK
jgi:hypothetical protein